MHCCASAKDRRHSNLVVGVNEESAEGRSGSSSGMDEVSRGG